MPEKGLTLPGTIHYKVPMLYRFLKILLFDYLALAILVMLALGLSFWAMCAVMGYGQLLWVN